jgi:hypothetical protein
VRLRLVASAVGAALLVVGAASGRPFPFDLALTLSGPLAVELHAQARFVIEVDNESAGPGLPTRVTVQVPAGMRYVAAPGAAVACVGTTGTVVCQLPTVPATFPFPVASSRPGTARIAATAESDVPDPRPENNVGRADVLVYGLQLRLLRTTPVPPRAGARFAAAATLFRTGTRTVVAVRSASCPASVGPSPLRGRPTVGPQRVTCTWTIPARTQGRTLRGAIVVRRPSGYSPKLSFRRVIG